MEENILESQFSNISEISNHIIDNKNNPLKMFTTTYVKKKVKNDHNINVPHISKMNNLKSQKYFSSENKDNLLNDALNLYKKINNNSKFDTNSTDSKYKDSKNTGIKINKNLIKYAEPRSAIKKAYKLKQKIFEDIDDDSDEEGLGENLIFYNKNKSHYSVGSTTKNNNHQLNNNHIINNNTNQINNNNININIKTSLPSIPYINESFSTKNSKKERLNTTDIEQLDIKIPKIINFKYLILFEELFDDLIKDIDLNKMNIYQNKMSIVEDYLNLFNENEIKLIFQIFDIEFETSKNSVQKVCTNFLILFTLFLYLLVIINYINKIEKDNYLSGLKNIIFYLHQNYNCLVFIILYKYNDENNNNEIDNNNNNTDEFYLKCKNLIKDNQSWLNKSNCKKIINNNNKIIKNILRNISQLIITYFHNVNIKDILVNEYHINDQINENKNNNNENYNLIDIESTVNLFKFYIKSLSKTRLKCVIETLQLNITLTQLLNIQKINKNINNTTNNSDNNNNKTDNNLPVPNPPFLSKREDEKYKSKYTLVLDLDETLVHYIEDSESAYVQIRPGAEDFIKELSEYFEIVIFTAALQSYGDIVIDGIDLENKISARLFRQHTIPAGNVYIKDLSKLGRELKYIIIIDNCSEVYSLQPKNGLNVKNFEGDENDVELEILKDNLMQLIKDNPDDVRDYLFTIQNKMSERYLKENANLNISDNNNSINNKNNENFNNNSNNCDFFENDNKNVNNNNTNENENNNKINENKKDIEDPLNKLLNESNNSQIVNEDKDDSVKNNSIHNEEEDEENVVDNSDEDINIIIQ